MDELSTAILIPVMSLPNFKPQSNFSVLLEQLSYGRRDVLLCHNRALLETLDLVGIASSATH